MSFIPVKEYENDSDSESVDHQLAEFNRLPLITLKNMYHSKTLYYRLDGKITAVSQRTGDDILKEPFFVEPESGWNDKQFFVRRKPRSSNSSHDESLNTSLKTENSISDDKLYKLREWIYISDQGGEDRDEIVCVSVITTKYAASAFHCFPKAEVGHEFRILNANDDEDELRNWKPVKVKHVDKDSDLIIFGSPSGVDLFASAPLIRQLPVIGTRYIAFGLGPRPTGDLPYADGITCTHGIIASNFIDKANHIMGDSGNNGGYSGGLVLSQKGQHLLGLNTMRSCAYRSAKEALKMQFGEWIDVLGDQSQPRSFILSNTHIKQIVAVVEMEQKMAREREEMEHERVKYEEEIKKLEEQKRRKSESD